MPHQQQHPVGDIGDDGDVDDIADGDHLDLVPDVHEQLTRRCKERVHFQSLPQKPNAPGRRFSCSWSQPEKAALHLNYYT